MPERGRHGKAPCGHFAMPGVFDYPYTSISILLSVLLYIYIKLYYHIAALLYSSISTLSYIYIVLFISIWIYRNINISILVLFPFASFSPCTALLCFPQTWRNCPGAKLLFTPEQQGREVEHFLGALRTTPHTYYGCSTLSGLPSESKARSFSQKLIVVHASLRE